MKIKCEYCGTYIDDTNATCPHCGSPCSGVRRTADGQPMTIEELKQWYEDRHLPPYEVTRFFIGENYTEPRAFGIYREEDTGNIVVYKNKDTGERAIRYKGTDEAYGVNELLQRLKQEILQQKAAGIGKKPGGSSDLSPRPTGKKKIPKALLVLLPLLPFILISVLNILALVIADEPKPGYYAYDNSIYYYFDGVDGGDDSWFRYDETKGEWDTLWTDEDEDQTAVPYELQKNRRAKAYFIESDWEATLPCTDVTTSTGYEDAAAGYMVDTGYYDYGDTTYYHLYPGSLYGWYLYSPEINDWDELEPAEVPEDLIHSTSSQDFYTTEVWDSSIQASDFTDTPAYKEYEKSREENESSDWNNNDNSSFDWDSGSSWDSGGTDWSSDW